MVTYTHGFIHTHTHTHTHTHPHTHTHTHTHALTRMHYEQTKSAKIGMTQSSLKISHHRYI